MIKNLDELVYVSEDKAKTRFYPSDFNKPNIELYLKFKGVKETNPPKWSDTLKWGAGNGVEEQMLKILKMNGIVKEDYNQKEHGGFKMEREGIEIGGYTDARTIDGLPIEIKSINNKNSFDIKKYEDGYPRENYVGQLSIYMDYLGVDTGYLFASTVDGLSTFWFVCKKIDDGVYQCGNVIVDIYKEYRRWSKLKTEYIDKDREPKWTQYLYKRDVREIDFKKELLEGTISKSAIQEARMGRKVIGDWEVSYSPYKNLIIEKQGVELGYTLEELEIIKTKTEGYTSWIK